MNYVRHLNAFFTIIKDNKNISASHISLYMALFQYWNFNRFANPFPIYRENIMQMSRISKNTYHKCMRELHSQQFIIQHVPLSKFHMMRITVIPLYQEKETQSRYRQLKLFSPSQLQQLGVSILSHQCTNIDPLSGSDLSHYIKPNTFNENNVCKTHPQVFLKEDISSSTNPKNTTGGKASSGTAGPGPTPAPLRNSTKVQMDPPTFLQVQTFFEENHYPSTEADKFFHYNQSKNWMLTEKFHVKDWQSLAHKWMLNSSFHKGDAESGGLPLSTWRGGRGEVQSLYSRFLAGENINKHLNPAYFDELQLSLTDEIASVAKQRRINQLSGSNEQSELNLLRAYTTNENQHLLTKDRSNLISLAKRLATLNHFETLKSAGKTVL